MPISNCTALISDSISLAPNLNDSFINYGEILNALGLQYKSNEYYWQVGDININRGWILHLSSVKPQIPYLLHLILPTLTSEGVCFKIARDSTVANYILEGTLGFDYLCKIIAIYPHDNDHVLQLAKQLLHLTQNLKGPAIPTDQFLGGILYTQYISFTEIIRDETNAPIWPFQELSSTNPVRPHKLLNFKYYTVFRIKQDAKGDVIKAIFFKKPWKVSSCILKQGKKYMLFDDAERDIWDRLQWQQKLHQQLSENISLPRVIDFFTENQDAYLALEYIKGPSFTTLLQQEYAKHQWNLLPTESQLLLTEYLLKIIIIIKSLHRKGFVHRDITPENFLIDRNRRVWIIDVELMWSIDSTEYNIPFQTGTSGFMSPEQEKSQIPTIKEDIYAMGALMLAIYTNMHPNKFLGSSPEQLKTTIQFITQNDILPETISKCLSFDPNYRPDINTLHSVIISYIETIKEKTNSPKFSPQIDSSFTGELRNIIHAALRGLNHPSLLSHQRQWLSRKKAVEERLLNPQFGMIVYSGWHTGVAGPLWLLAEARRSGFDIESCMELFNQNWNFIFTRHSQNKIDDNSLYSGGAGIALSLGAAFDCHLLCPDDKLTTLDSLFSRPLTKPFLSEGVAGQGMALLQVKHWMDTTHSQQQLSSYVQLLLQTQSSDGSWHPQSHGTERNEDSLSLDKGVPGIIWFLLHYLDVYPDRNVLSSVVKATNWLVKSGHRKSKSKSTALFKTNTRIAEITLVLIKAFTVTGNNRYRDIAISNLKDLPERPHFTDFTIANGLAGLGEVYLEAYKSFKDPVWLQRAWWITELFIHTFQFRSSSEGYWVMEGRDPITADLFTGNGGAIHFLMHFLLPDKLKHPLSVNYNRDFE